MDGNDYWLIELGKMIEEQESQLGVVNTDRIEHIKIAEAALREIVSGIDVDIVSKIHEPYKSMGYVSVTGKQIVIIDHDIFAKISRLASNVEVCPKTDGTVQVDFTFHGLVK